MSSGDAVEVNRGGRPRVARCGGCLSKKGRWQKCGAGEPDCVIPHKAPPPPSRRSSSRRKRSTREINDTEIITEAARLSKIREKKALREAREAQQRDEDSTQKKLKKNSLLLASFWPTAKTRTAQEGSKSTPDDAMIIDVGTTQNSSAANNTQVG